MKTVSFVNMKGGVAKTTMAVNVADCLTTRHGLNVLVIDIDPQFNATQCLVSGEDYKEHLDNHGHTVVVYLMILNALLLALLLVQLQKNLCQSKI